MPVATQYRTLSEVQGLERVAGGFEWPSLIPDIQPSPLVL